MPWSLLFLDRTLTLIYTSPNIISALVENSALIISWFSYCCGDTISSYPGFCAGKELTEKDCLFLGIEYKKFSQFCHELCLVPNKLAEHDLYR